MISGTVKDLLLVHVGFHCLVTKLTLIGFVIRQYPWIKGLPVNKLPNLVAILLG
jgi:hypothetical protein